MGRRRLRHPDAARAELESRPRRPVPPRREGWWVVLYRANGEKIRLKRSPGTRPEAVELVRERLSSGEFTHAWFGQYRP